MNSFFGGDLPAQLFSPAKMFYIAYVVLSVFKKDPANWWQFAFFSLLFIIIEIAHNDYFRIKLNHAACDKCQCGCQEKKDDDKN